MKEELEGKRGREERGDSHERGPGDALLRSTQEAVSSGFNLLNHGRIPISCSEWNWDWGLLDYGD